MNNKEKKETDFSKEFQIKIIGEDGNNITQTTTITTDGTRAGKGYNGPLIVHYNKIKGYYKNSAKTSLSSLDKFEYIICALGKKLGISMADTYKVYRDGEYQGIISESVDKPGDNHYDISDIFKLNSQDDFPINLEGIKEIGNEYQSLKTKENIQTFEDKDQTREFVVLHNKDDIEKAISWFPKLVSLFQISEEQKTKINQDYYNMVLLDLITGNVDRNLNNYGLVKRREGKIEFSPLYDNSTIAIPYIPSNFIQINSSLIDKDMLLECLFENRYDKIRHLTSKISENNEEIKQFLQTICERELSSDERKWFLEGTLLPNIEKICRKEKQKNSEDIIIEYEERKPLKEPKKSHKVK